MKNVSSDFGLGRHGVRATRKPTALLTLAGAPKMRSEERRKSVDADHAPPRTTRLVPVVGPVGFAWQVDG